MYVKRVLVAFLVLVVLTIGILLLLKNKKNNKPTLSLPETNISVEEQIKDKFPSLKIPSDMEKIELKSVSGGEGMGIATRSEIVADLPDLLQGENYQVFLSNGIKTVLLGNMVYVKGGYLINYDSLKYPGYNQIVITKNAKHILEGSF
jgi:hypothetical protein